MSGFNWDNDTEFRDMPEEVNGDQPVIPPVVNAARMSPPVQQPVQQHIPVVEMAQVDPEQVEEEDYEAVLADANIRIDMASLYRMVMNHNLFEGLDVDQRAVDTVQKQIRKFAKERLEVMLGMRQDNAAVSAQNSTPFNDLEVLVLKKLASQFSKGATESEAAKTPQPEVKQAIRKEGLNTISGGQKPAPKPVTKPAAKAVQNLVSKPQSPLQRQPKPVVQESKPLEKPIHEMTEEEIIERNKEAAARQRGQRAAPSKSALPMPTIEQEEMLHTQRALEMGNPGAVSAIVAALNKNKSQ